MFILSEDRKGSPEQIKKQFSLYRDYISGVQHQLPPVVHQLATSSWYYSGDHPRSPHDARLRTLSISEERNLLSGSCQLNIIVHLLSAARSLQLRFVYLDVHRYCLDYVGGSHGHQDWRFDEFRLSSEKQLEHEIEWAGAGRRARWTIVSSDLLFESQPVSCS